MSVAFDAVSGATMATSVTSPLTYAHTCSGADGLLIVAVAVGSNGDTGNAISSVTYNGTGMSLLTSRHSNDQTAGWVSLYYLVAPSTGSAFDVVVTVTGTIVSIESGAVSFTGANQSTPFGTPVTAISTTTTVSVDVPTVSATSMVIDAVCTGFSVNSSAQTMRSSANFNGITGAGNAATSTATGTGTVTMSYTVNADWSAIVAAEVLASGAVNWTQTPTDSAGLTDVVIDETGVNPVDVAGVTDSTFMPLVGDSLTWTVTVT